MATTSSSVKLDDSTNHDNDDEVFSPLSRRNLLSLNELLDKIHKMYDKYKNL